MKVIQIDAASSEAPKTTRTASTIAPPLAEPVCASGSYSLSPATAPSSRRQEDRSGQSGSESPRDHIRPSLRFSRALAVLLLFGAVVYLSARYFIYAHTWVGTDNAYLVGHIHSISSRVTGTVKEVLVDDNQAVTAGMIIVRLDPAEFLVRRQQALAEVAQAAAQVKAAEAQIAQADAQANRERARAIKARQDLTRATSLFEGGSGAISRQELDLAKAESDASDAAFQAARSGFDSATASGAAAKAQEQVAQASLANAELQLSYTAVLAPTAGRIGRRNIEVGNRIQPGQDLLALLQPDVWVTANFKETQLAHLKPGQAVRVKADAFPGHNFRGTVDSLSPASGAQFALLPPDNATGNFTKVVQRVPVKILLDPASLGDLASRLVAGMSVAVEVNVHD
jgi:membrane fusion protein, multidrug efflux system